MAKVLQDFPLHVNVVGGGAALTTSYLYSSWIDCSAADVVSIWVKGTSVGAGNVTSYEVKLQSSEDGTNFVEEYTIRTSNNTAANEQSLACTAGNVTYMRLIANTVCRKAIRVGFKASATGALAAGDKLAISISTSGEQR